MFMQLKVQEEMMLDQLLLKTRSKVFGSIWKILLNTLELIKVEQLIILFQNMEVAVKMLLVLKNKNKWEWNIKCNSKYGVSLQIQK